MDFAALFPPLLPPGAPCASDAAVDISTDDLQIQPLEKAVDAGIYRALRRWNVDDPAHVEAALPYLERVRKYQRVANVVLQEATELDERHAQDEDEDESADETVDEADEVGGKAAAVAKARKQLMTQRHKEKQRRRLRKQLRSEQRRFRAVVEELDDVDELREQRRPSDRLQRFVATFAPKKRRLVQKRSLADTVTALSFDFARPQVEADAVETELEATVSAASVAHVKDTDPVLWLDVLHPSKDPSRTQSFLVRQSQRLTEIVDLIACANDERLHEHGKPSKLVYFGRKFFVDRRLPGSLDYSEQITSWIRAKPEREAKYGTFPADERVARSLHKATFADLELRVDDPGVYIHQGECEHLIRLRDARMPHEHDAPTSDGIFPLRLPNPHDRRLRNCLICQHYSAKYVCYGDRLAMMDPMFFCQRCYRAAHYDAEGKLIYNDFLSFPFVQE